MKKYNILDEIFASVKGDGTLNPKIFNSVLSAIGVFMKRDGKATITPFVAISSICPTIEMNRKDITGKIVFRKCVSTGEWEVYKDKRESFNLVPDLNIDKLEKGFLEGYEPGYEVPNLNIVNVD